jgi:Zn-dependent protease with chaperone function
MIFLSVVPSEKSDCYSSFRRVYVTYGLLATTTDPELSACVYHELGHVSDAFQMFHVVIPTLFSYLVLLVYLPFFWNVVSLPFFYSVLYYFMRKTELSADRFALANTDLSTMTDFLNTVDHENLLGRIFFLFRWHPTRKKRLDFLMKINSLEVDDEY